MNDQKKLEVVFTSQIFGTKAFKKGIKSAPALDKDFFDYLKTIENVENAVFLAVENWCKGWHLSNLNQKL
jgi:hypothetical protein